MGVSGDEPRATGIHYSPDIQVLSFTQQRLTLWDFDTLSAPFWRFYWNANVGASISFDGIEHEMTPDKCFLIPPNTAAASQLGQPVEHLYIHFTAREPYYSLKPELFALPMAGDIEWMTQQLIADLNSEERNDQRFCLLALSLVHCALTRVPADRLRLHRTDERIDRVMEAMELRLEKKQPNEELAKLADMHTNAFTRLFRRVTGYSPQRYLNMKRVERACIMLHRMSVSIEDVAEALGFCDRYHFSRVFKQIRGMGPAAFQKTIILPDNQES